MPSASDVGRIFHVVGDAFPDALADALADVLIAQEGGSGCRRRAGNAEV